MDAIHLNKIVEKDGEILLTGLPFKKGESVEMILLQKSKRRGRGLTAGQLRRSKLVGLWKDRKDIQDSASFARELRRRAEHREA